MFCNKLSPRQWWYRIFPVNKWKEVQMEKCPPVFQYLLNTHKNLHESTQLTNMSFITQKSATIRIAPEKTCYFKWFTYPTDLKINTAPCSQPFNPHISFHAYIYIQGFETLPLSETWRERLLLSNLCIASYWYCQNNLTFFSIFLRTILCCIFQKSTRVC